MFTQPHKRLTLFVFVGAMGIVLAAVAAGGVPDRAYGFVAGASMGCLMALGASSLARRKPLE